MAGCFPGKLRLCLTEQVCRGVKCKSTLSSPEDRIQCYIFLLLNYFIKFGFCQVHFLNMTDAETDDLGLCTATMLK